MNQADHSDEHCNHPPQPPPVEFTIEEKIPEQGCTERGKTLSMDEDLNGIRLIAARSGRSDVILAVFAGDHNGTISRGFEAHGEYMKVSIWI